MSKDAGAGRNVTLKIPAELYRNLARMIENTGFRSVTEFAVYVLRDVAAGGRLEEGLGGYRPGEIRAIRDRLRALGYIE
ncbi:MAG: CopG family transcriptional regulator [Planctomycetes bacterium]|nr:CopG family transcriptional regulator [Planctomycetota bacterium]